MEMLKLCYVNESNSINQLIVHTILTVDFGVMVDTGKCVTSASIFCDGRLASKKFYNCKCIRWSTLLPMVRKENTSSVKKDQSKPMNTYFATALN